MRSPAGVELIAFLTDYGLRDGFPAVCHAVIAGIVPEARILDVSHDIPRHDVGHGAAVLARVAAYLPPAVYLAVVDPGVGTARRGIAVRAGHSVLVGPDNGLLLPAARALGGVDAAYGLDNQALQLPGRAATFDGRDVFAPVAARLFGGVSLPEVGARLRPEDLVSRPEPLSAVDPRGLTGEVTYVDGFGNVQLAAGPADLRAAGLDSSTGCMVRTGEVSRRAAVGRTFGDAPPGGLLVYVDADGRVALAVNGGRAVDLLGARVGADVQLDVDGS